jgi:xanthine dehydrogenase accessory factor
MKYSFPKILETLLEEKKPILATIIETSGSAPQVPGASAVFAGPGLIAGTVGGGLMEAQAEDAARECLKDGRCRLVSYRLDADPENIEGAVCGGEATVLFDPRIDEEKSVVEQALGGFKSRRPGLLLTAIEPQVGGFAGVTRKWIPDAGPEGFRTPSGARIPGKDIETMFKKGRPLLRKESGCFLFAEPVIPLPHLIIAGAGHVGRAVAHLGNLLDFEITVIDDRAEFANENQIPEADTRIVRNIGRAVAEIPESDGNYYVIVTRGHSHDAEALRSCVSKKAAYVGMIGSKTKVALMKKEFLEKGWATPQEWSRIHTPIGLDIRSKTVEEIAVSIAAQLVLVRAGTSEKEG